MGTRTISSAPVAVDSFIPRHLGPSAAEQTAMLAALGYDSLEAFIDAVVPESIRFRGTLNTGPARSEAEVLGSLKAIASSSRCLGSSICHRWAALACGSRWCRPGRNNAVP